MPSSQTLAIARNKYVLYKTFEYDDLVPSISTYLSGRYVSIPVFPLSFSEYLDFKSQSNRSTQELFNDYLHYGGFPIVALGDFDERAAYQIVDGIYNSVITNPRTGGAAFTGAGTPSQGWPEMTGI